MLCCDHVRSVLVARFAVSGLAELVTGFRKASLTLGVRPHQLSDWKRNMGVKNYLIDGVSCAGKTTVCHELY